MFNLIDKRRVDARVSCLQRRGVWTVMMLLKK